MSTSAISHLVVVPSNSTERRTTFFQGYSEFWHPDFIKILNCLVFFHMTPLISTSLVEILSKQDLLARAYR